MSKYLILIIYLIFISLGLPDSLLGSGWPVMQKDFDVDSSYAGYVSMTISAMTIISALFSAQITSRLKEKWVVIISIGLTCIGLILFSISKNYWNLFLFSIPYGLGAGSIDASINNFVAVHYSSRVMNFLHCFYGVGSMISPNIMALALKYKNWKEGYRWTAYIQIFILAICFISLPLWNNENKKEERNNEIITINVNNKVDKNKKHEEIESKEELEKKSTEVNDLNKNDKKEKKDEEENVKVISILEAIKIKGVIFSCIAFFAFCSGEGTCFLWTSSFFNETKDGLSKESVASLSTTIYGGLMLGRVLSGLFSEKLGDKKLIRIGLIIEFVGIICVGIPIKTYILAIIGYCLTSIGMGPIYPSIQHLAPIYFGKEASATIIGLQMASAYVGTTFMPFIFGLIQEKTSMWAHPIYVGVFAILNSIFIEIEFKLCDKNIVDKNVNNEKNNQENVKDNDDVIKDVKK